MDLHKYLTNPFNNPNFGMDKLVAFGTDHLARLIANNPAAVFAARITATTTALAGVGGAFTDDKTKLALRKSKKQAKDAFRAALPAAISKIYGAVEGQFSEDSAEFLECFPHGRTVFSNCKDDKLEKDLQTLINGVTAHQPPLAATVVTSATALLTGWLAVYAPSETATGGKTSTQCAKKAARAALSLELFKNLLTLARTFPGQPAQLDVVYAAKPAVAAHARHPARASPPAAAPGTAK